MNEENENPSLTRLLQIMAQLRNPDGGCPWDRLQDFDTIAPFTVEEAYEVADAIDRGDMQDLKGELGDLLFQVVFHAQMASEAGHFDFSDVAQSICDKLVRRHPHVFAEHKFADAHAQTQHWEQIKIAESQSDEDASVLAGISPGLPEWMRALKLQKRAASIGFDWNRPGPVMDKVGEELLELREDFDAGADPERMLEEFGDLLFACCNLARHIGADPGRALRGANAKFEARFRAVELLAQSRSIAMADAELEVLDQLWDEVKATEKAD